MLKICASTATTRREGKRKLWNVNIEIDFCTPKECAISATRGLTLKTGKIAGKGAAVLLRRDRPKSFLRNYCN